MKSPSATLRGYTEDLVIVHKHILGVMREHITDEHVQQVPGAAVLVTEVVATLEGNLATLELHVQEMGGPGPLGQAEEAATSITAMLGSLYGKFRRHTAARMLRDDYTAVTFLGTCQMMLHTTALSLGDTKLAAFVAELMRDIPHLIMRLGDIIPVAVVTDLGREVPVNAGAAAVTVQVSHDSWRSASGEAA